MKIVLLFVEIFVIVMKVGGRLTTKEESRCIISWVSSTEKVI